MSLELARWVREQVDYDERVARGAIDQRRPGQRWHWVGSDTDTPVAPGSIREVVDGDPGESVSLRTVEEFPTNSVGDLPAFIIYEVDDLPDDAEWALDHIALWDPARVLSECQSKRLLLMLVFSEELVGDAADQVVRRMALAFRHRDGFPAHLVREDED